MKEQIVRVVANTSINEVEKKIQYYIDEFKKQDYSLQKIKYAMNTNGSALVSSSWYSAILLFEKNQ